MLNALALALVLASYTAYPGFGDRIGVLPPSLEKHPTVEATTDRGPIVEIIVRCYSSSAIISYSKIERTYCSPTHHCTRDLAMVLSRTCR